MLIALKPCQRPQQLCPASLAARRRAPPQDHRYYTTSATGMAHHNLMRDVAIPPLRGDLAPLKRGPARSNAELVAPNRQSSSRRDARHTIILPPATGGIATSAPRSRTMAQPRHWCRSLAGHRNGGRRSRDCQAPVRTWPSSDTMMAQQRPPLRAAASPAFPTGVVSTLSGMPGVWPAAEKVKAIMKQVRTLR